MSQPQSSVFFCSLLDSRVRMLFHLAFASCTLKISCLRCIGVHVQPSVHFPSLPHADTRISLHSPLLSTIVEDRHGILLAVLISFSILRFIAHECGPVGATCCRFFILWLLFCACLACCLFLFMHPLPRPHLPFLLHSVLYSVVSTFGACVRTFLSRSPDPSSRLWNSSL